MGKGHPGRLCGRGRTRAGGPGEGRARAEGPHRPGKGRATGNRPPWRERAAAVGAVHCGKGQARPRRAFRERRRRPARRRAQGIVGRRRSGAGGGRWPAAPGRRARTAPAPPRPASDGAHAQRGGGRKRPGCRDDGVGPAARLSRSGPAAAGSPARPGPAHAAESAALRPAAGRPLGECPGRGPRRPQPGRGGPQAGGEAAVCLSGAASRPASLSQPPPRYSRPRAFFWEAGPGPVAERGAAVRLEVRLSSGSWATSAPSVCASSSSRPCVRPPPPPSPWVLAAAALLHSSRFPVEKVVFKRR